MAKAEMRNRQSPRNSSKNNGALHDVPMQEIVDAASVVNKLLENIAMMTPGERAELAVVLTTAIMNIGLD